MKKLILASIMLLLILAGCSSKDAGVTFIDITQLDEKISNNEDKIHVQHVLHTNQHSKKLLKTKM